MEVRASNVDKFRGTFGVGRIRRVQRRRCVLLRRILAYQADCRAADCDTGPDVGIEGGRVDLHGDGGHPRAGGVDVGLSRSRLERSGPIFTLMNCRASDSARVAV